MRLGKPSKTALSVIETILTILFMLAVYFYMLYTDFQKREVVEFSQLSICTKSGESVRETSGPDGLPLFHVPKEVNRIYICGTLETPIRVIVGIDLLKINNGNKNAVFIIIPSRTLQSGPFIYDVISTERLETGEYRAIISIGRIDKGDVRFLIER